MATTPVFLPEESQGQRRLVGHSPRDHKESDAAACTCACRTLTDRKHALTFAMDMLSSPINPSLFSLFRGFLTHIYRSHLLVVTNSVWFVVITVVILQLLGCCRLFVTPWAAACQASLSLHCLPELAQTLVH